MASQKKILRGMIIFILAVFLLSTALMSVMYFGSPKAPSDTAVTGENLVITWTNEGTGE